MGGLTVLHHSYVTLQLVRERIKLQTLKLNLFDNVKDSLYKPNT